LAKIVSLRCFGEITITVLAVAAAVLAALYGTHQARKEATIDSFEATSQRDTCEAVEEVRCYLPRASGPGEKPLPQVEDLTLGFGRVRLTPVGLS
jgi:hypothetical protein